jgi:mannose-1-phosphate guanylyltransferase
LTPGDPVASSKPVKLTALILAGGGGTRLWPLSRRSHPKQFLDAFASNAGEEGAPSLLQETFGRLDPVVPASRVWVVAGRAHEAAIRASLPAMAKEHLVLEPAAKNTAPAIGLGVAAIAAEDPDAVVAVLPSDHAIRKAERFRALLAAAGILAAEQKMLVTLGIVADRPATGYGYIQKGEPLGRVMAAEAFRVGRFVEKPDARKAKQFLESGDYLWNSGMFVWRAADLLEEIDRHLPDLGKGLADYGKAAAKDRPAIAERVFATAPSISIDYAVMEKSDRVGVLPADIGWDDIGTFRSLSQVNPDATGGAATAKELIAIDAAGNLVHAPGKTVALVGVEDLIVVDTPDALLILPRDRAEDVKKVVEELAKKKRDDLL